MFFWRNFVRGMWTLLATHKPSQEWPRRKSLKCWPSFQTSQITIWSNIHKTSLNKFKPWMPNRGSELAMTHHGISCGFWHPDIGGRSFLQCGRAHCPARGGRGHQGVLLPSRGVFGLQRRLSGWFVSVGIHMNASTHYSPQLLVVSLFCFIVLYVQLLL